MVLARGSSLMDLHGVGPVVVAPGPGAAQESNAAGFHPHTALRISHFPDPHPVAAPANHVGEDRTSKAPRTDRLTTQGS